MKRSGRVGLVRDLTHLLRSFRRAPASPVAAIVTLSLTLGAGTAIFSVVDAVLLTPPPFEDPAALFTVGESPESDPGASARTTEFQKYQSWRSRAEGIAELEAYDPTNFTLTGERLTERIRANDVSPGFLSLLGVSPAMGRLFDPGDAGERRVVVSHRFWGTTLGEDPSVLGHALRLSSEPHAIIGVLPPDFSFALSPGDVWRVFPLTPAAAEEAAFGVRVVARLAPGVGASRVEAALGQVSRAGSQPTRIRAAPLSVAIAGDSAPTLSLLAVAAALASLIALTNLGVLLLVRSLDRRRELAVRSALGAGDSEPRRQLAIEAGVLVVLGITGGVIAALWLTPTVAAYALELGGVAEREISISWRMILILGAGALACAWAAAFIAASGASRKAMDVLRSRISSTRRERGVRRVFVGAEVAVALVLLVSLALAGQSLLSLLETHPGFHSRGVLTAQMSLPPSEYPSEQEVAGFYTALQRALQDRLGTGTVSLVDELPLTGAGGRQQVAASGDSPPTEAVLRVAAPGYFDVMSIPVLSGRAIGWPDIAEAPPRAVISAELARELFGTGDPVGVQFWVEGIQESVEVVGVVGDVKHRALDEAWLPTVYLSAQQFPSASSILVVRNSRPGTAETVQQEAAALDPRIPVYGVRVLEEVVSGSPGVPARRLVTAALAAFGVLALLLAAVGVFGVSAHEVASRRAELALRMALGASPAAILAGTLGTGLRLVGSGLAAGAVLSAWAAVAMNPFLIDMGPRRLLGSGAVAAAVLLVIASAAVLPAAVRAAHSHPRQAMMGE